MSEKNTAAPRPARWRTILGRLLRDPFAAASLAFLLLVIVCAVFRDVLAPYDPLANDLQNALQLPSAEHWLGTDGLGRDTLSRLIFSSQVALLAAVEAAGIALVVGVPVGLASGYFGGWIDRIVMRVVDALTALPGLIVAIAVIAALGPGVGQAMLALGLVFSTTFVRVTRGEVLAVREQQYVEAARVTGVGTTRILFRHVLPNIVGPLFVQLSLTLAAALLAEAALSFLGLSAQPPNATWGVMVAEGGTMLARQPFLIVPPGLAIGLTVLSLNIVADALLAALRNEPAHRRRRRPDGIVAPVAGAAPAPVTPVTREVPDDARPPLLRITGLDVAVTGGKAEVPLLDGVSLSVEAGQTLGLVGESGSGKTMTALAALQLLPGGVDITAGSIQLEGRELIGLDDAGWNRVRGSEVAMIFQEPSSALNPAFTIGQQIVEAVRVHTGLSRKEAREKAVHLLDRVGIRDPHLRVDNYPHQLSGGMAQRAMVALAISCDPKLLIADEPTTALDVTLKVQVADLLADLQRETGMGMIFVTHELGMVADLADRVAVMYGGQVVEERGVDELFADPWHPYTTALLESTSQGRPRGQDLSIIPGTVPAPGHWGSGCRFADRCAVVAPACRTAAVPLLDHGGGRVRCVRSTAHLEQTEAPR